MRRPLAVCVLLALAALLALPAAAQNNPQPVLDRVDQAMAHLTDWLDLGRPITRQTNFWQWREVIYGDAAFGCGVPGQSYPAEPARGLDIDITHDNVDYDYRVAWDGTLLVLCGSNGLPLYRSDDPALAQQGIAPTAFPPTAAAPADLSGGSDFSALIYMTQQQRFYRIDRSGERQTFTRFGLSGEAIGGPVQMAVSRDGRHLAQVLNMQDGSQTLYLTDLLTDRRQVIPARPNETITLGWDFDPDAMGLTGRSAVFSPGSTFVAVGFYNAADPATNRWRLTLIDLSDGSVRGEIDQTTLPGLLQNPDETLSQAVSGEGSYAAYPVYIDAQGVVHAQLILQAAGGSQRVPAFAWDPVANRAVSSPYTDTAADIRLADGVAVVAQHNPDLPAAPQDGMLPPNNMLLLRDNSTPLPTQQILLSGSTTPILRPRWAADGDQIVYRTPVGAGSPDERSVVLDIATGEQYILPGYAVGAPDGVLVVYDGATSPEIALYRSGTDFETLWAAPPQNGDPVFVWVQSSAAPSALADACGDLPSIVAVGMAARTTIVDGRPLNVRDAPNATTAAVVRIIPEDTRFTIIGGPECANSYTWWQIRLTDGVTGWVAEAGSEFYFIEPAP